MSSARADDYNRARMEYLRAGRPATHRGPRYAGAEEDDWLAEQWLLDELQPDEVEDEPRPSLADRSPQLGRAVTFGRQHARALGVVALLVCLLVGVFVLRAGSRSVPLSAVPLDPGSTGPAATAASASASMGSTPVPSATASQAPLRVHVLGAVRRPGVVRLVAGARVADAIATAGGFTSKAAPGELNLAAPLLDGDQVVIGTKQEPRGEVRHPGEVAAVPGQSGSEPGSGTNAASAAEVKVNLNTATSEQLDGLPGVGPVTAQRILDWRDEHQKFSRVEELQEVDGIGPKTYAQLADHVRV
ncbi:helix-hairpin-helix domain-containing protein [Luteococcus sanguinis]|uniref:Helix-hairpin-helix domain-containing protein n=1 Tax=Luteococcus sanguinis TaxID=174038 RepID=A0ABW1X185_9ACTN